jgi:hypothetical protein
MNKLIAAQKAAYWGFPASGSVPVVPQATAWTRPPPTTSARQVSRWRASPWRPRRNAVPAKRDAPAKGRQAARGAGDRKAARACQNTNPATPRKKRDRPIARARSDQRLQARIPTTPATASDRTRASFPPRPTKSAGSKTNGTTAGQTGEAPDFLSGDVARNVMGGSEGNDYLRVRKMRKA